MIFQIAFIKRVVYLLNKNLPEILKKHNPHHVAGLRTRLASYWQMVAGIFSEVAWCWQSRGRAVPRIGYANPAETVCQRALYATAQFGATIRAMHEPGPAQGGYITYAKIFEALPALLADITLLPEAAGFLAGS